jgi:hypothetical protein
MHMLLVARLAASACPGPLGNQVTAYRVTSDIACVLIENCFFALLHAGEDGGAVYVFSASCSVDIMSTTFLSCSTENSRDGGACYFDCDRISVDRCCARLCRGWRGQFLYSSCRSSANTVKSCSLFECAPSTSGNEADCGGIFIPDAAPYSLSILNFTACYSSSAGSALYFSVHLGSIVCSSLTCFGCLGQTAIWNYRYQPIPTIDFSNFFDNSGLSSSVLYGPYDGMKVMNCIFMFNAREFLIGDKLSDSELFSIVNCVFSGSVPSMWFISKSGNWENLVTQSHAILHLNTEYCPGHFLSGTWIASRGFRLTTGPSVSPAWVFSTEFHPTSPFLPFAEKIHRPREPSPRRPPS